MDANLYGKNPCSFSTCCTKLLQNFNIDNSERIYETIHNHVQQEATCHYNPAIACNKMSVLLSNQSYKAATKNIQSEYTEVYGNVHFENKNIVLLVWGLMLLGWRLGFCRFGLFILSKCHRLTYRNRVA